MFFDTVINSHITNAYELSEFQLDAYNIDKVER